ncbi:hypothetical protein ACOSQ4_031927 [Xanthoceras sorbifolium]
MAAKTGNTQDNIDIKLHPEILKQFKQPREVCSCCQFNTNKGAMYEDTKSRAIEDYSSLNTSSNSLIHQLKGNTNLLEGEKKKNDIIQGHLIIKWNEIISKFST